jgi:hypothetical protein
MSGKIQTRLTPAQAARIAAAEARRVEAVALAQPVTVNGRSLTATQRDRLIEAERLAGGGLSERKKAAALVRSVEAELTAAREARAVDRGIEDTLARAAGRGEAFEVEIVDIGEWRRAEDGGLVRRNGLPVLDVQTVRRASRVDGLASLYKAGSIGDEEKRIGDACRVLFEQAKPPISSSQYGSSAGGGCDTGRMLVAVAEAGKAGAMVWQIARACRDVKVFTVLEAVAGRGATIRSLGDGGDLKARNLDRLRAGLAAAKGVIEHDREGRKARLADPKSKGLANQAR